MSKANTFEKQNKPDEFGSWMYNLMVSLFPVCRSITGPGNRITLDMLGEYIPLERKEIPTGTKLFDWTIPDEWIPHDAKIVGPDGRVYADFRVSNLHLLNYSEPVDTEMYLEELLPHIYTLPEKPDLVPYVTSYYKRRWGFCMTENQKKTLINGKYRVKIDVEIRPGSLSYGETVLNGSSDLEVLISTYICHPSLANDNLSSVVIAAALYQLLRQMPQRYYNYRFVFAPETIGALAWLNENKEVVKERTYAGLALSCMGGNGPLNYKASRRGNAEIDQITKHLLTFYGGAWRKFVPFAGGDDRQFGSPGFDLPVGWLSRNIPGEFPWYHNSGDSVDHIDPEDLVLSLVFVYQICRCIELNVNICKRIDPYGEPQLAKRGLYNDYNIHREEDVGFQTVNRKQVLLWVLNLSDGHTSFLEMGERTGISMIDLFDVAMICSEHGLIDIERIRPESDNIFSQ